MNDVARIPRVLSALERTWRANPHLRLGELLEHIENRAWDIPQQRVHAPRLMWLSDELFEAALNATPPIRHPSLPL